MVEAVMPSLSQTVGVPTDAPPREPTERLTVVPGAPGSSQVSSAIQDADPTMTLIRAVDRLGAFAEKIGGSVEKQPPGPRGVLAVAVIVAIVSGTFSGAITAIGAVWVHDSDTRGRLGTRLDKQDEALDKQDEALRNMATALDNQAATAKSQAQDQKNLVEVVEGLLDEHEAQAEWWPMALEAGFAKEPIPRMGTTAPKLRRRMPSQ